jgi:hypothetical protein
MLLLGRKSNFSVLEDEYSITRVDNTVLEYSRTVRVIECNNIITVQ